MDILLQEGTAGSIPRADKAKKNRKEISHAVLNFEEAVKKMSQRLAADSVGTPRTTLLYWRDRKNKIDLPEKTVNFFESPEGQDFLHRLVASIMFATSQLKPCGIRTSSLILKQSRLHYFVGSSYGSIQKLHAKMEKDIVTYGKEEGERLSAMMPLKKITTCQDETFHPEPCLVAIEPISNFILVEEYSEKRDAASWSDVMSKGLKDLSVEIIQGTSDEGTGLISYVKKTLGVHHSPDLFHVQQDLTKATTAPLNAHIRKAENAYEKSHIHTEKLRKIRELPDANIDEIDIKIAESKNLEATSLVDLEQCKKRKETVRNAKIAISEAYHPVDLKKGKMQREETINAKIEAEFETIKAVATESGLSENSHQRLEKAHRVFKQMTATIAFFWRMVTMQIKELALSIEHEKIIYDFLIPAFYLQSAAKKSKTSEKRNDISVVENKLWQNLTNCNAWNNLDTEGQQKLKTAAKNCVQLFQRSSSCVEGRNGQLSLWHHGLHKLSAQKLNALTTLHNYYIKRSDGSTAAERFFEQKPIDLFEYLLERFPYPARPKMSPSRLAA